MKAAHTIALGVALGSLATAGMAQDARSASAMPAYTPDSVQVARASAPTTGENDMAGSGVFLAIAALIAMILAIVIAAGGGNDSPADRTITDQRKARHQPGLSFESLRIIE